jgi:hypothetical protein
MAQVVEHLPSKHRVSSITGTGKKNTQQNSNNKNPETAQSYHFVGLEVRNMKCIYTVLAGL